MWVLCDKKQAQIPPTRAEEEREEKEIRLAFVQPGIRTFYLGTSRIIYRSAKTHSTTPPPVVLSNQLPAMSSHTV